MKALNDVWNEIVSALKAKLSTPGFKTFLSSTKPASFEDGILTISVPNEYTQNWIRERCETFISEHLKNALGSQILVAYQIDTKQAVDAEIDENLKMEHKPQLTPTHKSDDFRPMMAGRFLNPKYTFESFVVGHNNRFAHASAQAVAKAPGKAYNPLFLYGGAGLGKTHLMQAIGHSALSQNPNLKVLYVTSEEFTNDLINSIRDKRNEEFRARYRQIDVLLLDDVQFIAGKLATQEEFFHTFNTLHQAGKQIVLSSDRPPKEIIEFEERIRSRFEWGLLADLQVPELETRIAILRKKAESDGLNIPGEVIQYIASQIPTNIRQLEGALISIAAYASLINADITVEIASELIKDIIAPRREKPVTIALIKRITANHYRLTPEDLSAKSRTQEKALARQIAMFLARELTDSSFPKIGENFGGRDHTTVMHALDKISELMKTDSQMNDTVNTIKQQILAAQESY